MLSLGSESEVGGNPAYISSLFHLCEPEMLLNYALII